MDWSTRSSKEIMSEVTVVRYFREAKGDNLV